MDGLCTRRSSLRPGSRFPSAQLQGSFGVFASSKMSLHIRSKRSADLVVGCFAVAANSISQRVLDLQLALDGLVVCRTKVELSARVHFGGPDPRVRDGPLLPQRATTAL
jgi:hypothetical protein